MLEEGCAFEELISFHGGLGGPQTRPFVLHPAGLPGPPKPLVGAEAVHELLCSWRVRLQGATAFAQHAPLAAAGAEAPTRPAGITVVAILALVQALLSVVIGLARVGQSDAGALDAATFESIALITTGLLTLLVVRSLWVGRAWARLAIGALEAANLALGVRLTVTQAGSGFWHGLAQMGFATIVLVLLYAGGSDDFFAARKRRRRPSD